MGKTNQATEAAAEAKETETTVTETKTEAKKAPKINKITDDGKKHKQGDVVKINAFGVTIETKF